jgi:hypothetical protein
MKDTKQPTGNRSLELQAKIKEQLQKFEELRGFL